MPVISVIIPAYNAAKYIKRCISSVTSQSLRDIEIIVIDDGSTDATPAICDDLATTDSRISVIHQNNSGVSRARNIGLSLATGDYIHFCDCDDYIRESFYQDIYDMAIANGAEICCSTTLTENDKGVFIAPPVRHEQVIMSRNEALTELLLCRRVSYSLCDKLFKRTVLSEIKLNGAIYHNEDFLFCYEAIKNADTIAYTSKSYYYYCYNEGSAVNSPFNSRKMTAIDAQATVYKDILANIPELSEVARAQYYKVILYISSQILKSGYSNNNDRKRVRQIVRHNLFEIIKSDLACGYKIDALALTCGWWPLRFVSLRHK